MFVQSNLLDDTSNLRTLIGAFQLDSAAAHSTSLRLLAVEMDPVLTLDMPNLVHIALRPTRQQQPRAQKGSLKLPKLMHARVEVWPLQDFSSLPQLRTLEVDSRGLNALSADFPVMHALTQVNRCVRRVFSEVPFWIFFRLSLLEVSSMVASR